jgi:DNA-binding MarR family transcriptional regulator
VSGEIVRRGPFLLHFANSQQLTALLTRALVGAPLTADEFAVYSLLRLTGQTTPSRLASDLGMRASTMSHYLRRMAEKGHLARAPHPQDGRSSLIELTPSGVDVTEGCFKGFGRAIDTFRRHLAMPEKDLLEALDIMNRALTAAWHELTASEDRPEE